MAVYNCIWLIECVHSSFPWNIKNRVFSILSLETNPAVNFVISFRVADSSSGVGFYSVCSEYVLLPLVNRKLALAYGRNEHNQAGNLNRDIEKD